MTPRTKKEKKLKVWNINQTTEKEITSQSHLVLVFKEKTVVCEYQDAGNDKK